MTVEYHPNDQGEIDSWLAEYGYWRGEWSRA